MKDWKKDLLTIPNFLSLFRLLLVPVYVIIYLNAQEAVDYYVAAAILAVSCLTDMIDGQIARHFNMISNAGKVLDPLADKVTQFTLIVCLTVRYPGLLGLVCLFFIKEIYQLVAGYLLIRKGKILKGALLSGKICTTILFTSLILLVMLPTIPETTVYIIGAVDFAVVLLTFADYIHLYCTNGPMIRPLEEDPNNMT